MEVKEGFIRTPPLAEMGMKKHFTGVCMLSVSLIWLRKKILLSPVAAHKNLCETQFMGGRNLENRS